MTEVVAFLASTLARSGPTQQLLTIASGIDRQRWRPVVVTLSPEGERSRRADFEQADIEVRSLGLSRPQGLLRGHGALARELAAIKPGLVHSHGVRADLLAAGLGDLPRLATVRNVPWLDFPMTYGLPGYGLAAAHLGALRRFPRVVAVSATVAASIGRFLPRVDVIRNGVDLAHYRPAPIAEKQALREAHGIAKDALVVVATGHLSARKQPQVLVDAIRGLDNLVLVLVGDGPEAARLRRSIGDTMDVRLMGRQGDVRPFLALADLFASASRAEGFPNAVIEALASGLPCVLSDIGPHAEIAALAGDAVRLFPLGGVPTLRQHLRRGRALADLGALWARQTAEQNLASTAMIASYERLYAMISVHQD